MKRKDISHAIGNISTRHITEAENHSSHNFSVTSKWFSTKKIGTLVASLALSFTIALPTLAAADVQTAYEVLYAASPRIAQELKPVRITSEDQGILMEVISAYIIGDKAHIYVSMQDLIGGRMDETVDLFDSFRINRSFSSSATCERVSYDTSSNTATFLIGITQWDQEKIEGKKITFSVDQFLSNKLEYRDKIPQMDLNKVSLSPQIQRDVNIRGWSSIDGISLNPRFDDYLKPISEDSFSPIDGVKLTGLGFIDDKLHVQVYYENILETDNHGYVYLVDASSNEIRSEASVSYWDSEQRGSYEEYIFNITPSDLTNYDLYGHFWTSSSLTRGNWQVTFPLEYVK